MLKSVSSLQYYKVCVNVIIMEFKYYPSLIIAYGIASLILNLFYIICLSIILKKFLVIPNINFKANYEIPEYDS